ncbi:MAG: arsenite efflux transporter metallochaperone ArsD [Balneolaceae bacterium]
MNIQLFEPAMCCSTGVCGPDVDDELVQISSDVDWLKSQGVEVNRYNLSQEPEAFKRFPEILEKLQTEGTGVLPIIVVDGNILMQKRYPNREELQTIISEQKERNSMNGVKESNQQLITQPVATLIAIGTAMSSNNEDALMQHVEAAKNAGVKMEDISRAMQIGQGVKDQSSRKLVEKANELLGIPAQNGCAPGSGCC